MGSCLEALLVEDNSSDAQMVETIVGLADQAQPPHLHRAECLKEAVSKLETTTFDVVLLDLHLPDGEGTTLIRQIKRIAPQMPVVVISGLGDRDIEAAAFGEGADDYLIKSHVFSPQRIAEIGYADVGNLLVQRLDRAVRQAKLAAALEAQADQELSFQAQLYPSEIIKANQPSLTSPIDRADVDSLSPLQPNLFDHPTERFVQTTLYSVSITLMSTLGLLHLSEGSYSQAEPLLIGALEIRRRLLGPTHPDVIVSLHNLATLYDNQGNYLEAESLFYEALKLCEDIFGINSALTRKFRNNALVISRMNQGMDRSGQ